MDKAGASENAGASEKAGASAERTPVDYRRLPERIPLAAMTTSHSVDEPADAEVLQPIHPWLLFGAAG